MAVTHILALEFFLYWRYLWLDVPMHILGGVVAALGVFVLSDLRAPIPQHWFKFWPVLISVLVIAILWEIYEIKIGVLILDNYRLDTAADLSFGLLGGVIGYLIGSKLKNFESQLL